MIAIKNGKIVTPSKVVEGKVLLLKRDRIYGLADNTGDIETVIDAEGRYILPGLIDVHSDAIERYIQPRPTSQVDFDFGLGVCEQDLLVAGITTMYHSISLFQDEFFGKSPLRTKENVQKLADLIASTEARQKLIRHRFHLRIEIDNLEAFDIVSHMIREGKVHQISFMDHTPGQGQYQDLTVYYNSIAERGGKEMETIGFEGVLEHHKKKSTLSYEQLKELSDLAWAKGIPVASHDDDTEAKLTMNQQIGVRISEFPITLNVAKAAKALGFFTVVGAPNIVRGGSHSGNLSGVEAVLENAADIICSDYYPAAILHSIFLMHQEHGVPLHKMVKRATQNPARAMRTDADYGAIKSGKKADLLIVDTETDRPVITHVFVDGKQVMRVEPWR